MIDCVHAGDQQEIGKPVGDNAVDLLRHRSIEAAQARLDMGECDARLRSHESGRYRRVDVPVNNHKIRSSLQEQIFQALENCRGLAPLPTGPHAQVHVGPRQSQLPKEDLRHGVVVVLASVNQQLGDVMPVQAAITGAALGKLGARRSHEVAEEPSAFRGRYSVFVLAAKSRFILRAGPGWDILQSLICA